MLSSASAVSAAKSSIEYAVNGDCADVVAHMSVNTIRDAHTLYDGSMYSNSPTKGYWETYITRFGSLYRWPLQHHRESRQPQR